MEKPKSFAYTLVLILICLGFAIGSNYGMELITKTNMIYMIKEPKKIGAVYMTYNNPFYQILNGELKKIVNKNGDTLITLDPALSLSKQKKEIEYLIDDQKVDALVITPVNYKGLENVLKKAKTKNIPVIVVDTEVSNTKYISYNVSSDNYNAGVQCAQDMMLHLSSARIVLVEHSDANSAKLRIQGFLDTIKDQLSYQIVQRMECKGQLEKAMPKMEAFLQKGIDFDVVMCLNDPSALGAMAALEEMNILDGKYVYGIDGTPETKQLIQEGRMQATITQSPKVMGKKAGHAIYKLFKNKKIKKIEVLPVQKITKENVSDYSLEEWQ